MNASTTGRRWPRRLIIFVIVLAVVLVVLDRGGDLVAERFTADTLQSSQHLQTRPTIDIDGVPFLTQFASGHYQHVTIDADDLRVGHTPLYISHLHAEFDTVTVSRTFHEVRAATATADATVGFSALSKALHVHVRYAGHHRIRFSKKLPLIGRKTVKVSLSYAKGALALGKASINGLKGISSEVSAALHKLGIPLTGIPFDVRVRSLRVDRGGVELRLVGSHLHFTKS